MNSRKEELEKIAGRDPAAAQLIHEIIFIENRLQELRRLPFLKINPKNPEQQKATPAAKQNKELLQQYTNSLKLLQRIAGRDGEEEEDSPLRAWLRGRQT